MDDARTLWRECISDPLIQGLQPTQSATSRRKAHQKKRRSRSSANGHRDEAQDTTDGDSDNQTDRDPSGLSDFIERQYIADETFTALPTELTGLTYYALQDSPSLDSTYSLPLSRSVLDDLAAHIPPEVTTTLATTDLVSPSHDLASFLSAPLAAFITALTAPPPSSTPAVRATACEICDRDWIPLTYHHLIPRSVHAKAVKRGWHTQARLADVAWLCRACHSMVHRIASLEELARELYSVDRLLEREDVRRFGAWVGRVRWKTR